MLRRRSRRLTSGSGPGVAALAGVMGSGNQADAVRATGWWGSVDEVDAQASERYLAVVHVAVP